MPDRTNLMRSWRGAWRKGLGWVRVPRRIARGHEQRPHPHLAWRAAEERRYLYDAPGPLGDAGGVFLSARLNAAFKATYGTSILNLFPPNLVSLRWMRY